MSAQPLAQVGFSLTLKKIVSNHSFKDPELLQYNLTNRKKIPDTTGVLSD